MNGSSNYSLEEIVLTRNGEIYNPVDVRETIFLIVTKSICCLIGIPFNVTIAISTIRHFFIVGLGTIRCEMWLVHIKIITLILAILFVSCTALNVIVYRQTKTHLSDNRTLSPSSNDGGMDWTAGDRPIIIGDGSVRNVRGSPGNSDDPSANAGPAMSIHVGRRKFSQMEMEATRTLIIGVASLIVTCLGVILASSFFICRFIYGQSECSNYNWTGPYLRELLLFTAVYFPIILILRSKQLMLG